MRADPLPRAGRPDYRLRPGGQRQLRRVRSSAPRFAARAHAAGAWVHVDGAFGLWAAASPRYRHLTDGFSDADSWATDGHKWPNVGYDCGIAFVRDPRALQSAMAMASAVLHAGRGARAFTVHARDVAPRPRSRALGGPALARPRRARRPHRSNVRSCEEICRGASRPRLRHPERRRHQSGAGVVWLARRHPSGHRRACSKTAPAGAAEPSGTAARPCGSACLPGRRQPTMWT